MTPDSDLMSLKQTAKYLHQTPWTVYGLSKRRKNKGDRLPSLRLGRKLYFRKSTIDTWLAKQERV